jgi:arylsulfatase A-like enzyme
MRRREFLKQISICSGAIALSPILSESVIASPNRKHFNVLMIICDDLRPQLGCYGHPQMITPNIDRLATEGTLFSRSYCNAQVCGPSRASVFSGLRPTISRFIDNNVRLDHECPDFPTLHGHFKNNGYFTLSLGKVLHTIYDANDDWSKPAWSPDWEKQGDTYLELDFRDYQTEENKVIAHNHPRSYVGPAYECADVPDDAYYDGQIADMAVYHLSRMNIKNQPFFMAVGFKKPHLPFTAPKKYWDMYDIEKIQLPDNYFKPHNAPMAAFHNWGELRNYVGIPKKGSLSDDLARKVIHAYYAATSYSDANVGKLLNALDTYGLRENTIVLLWGDHGWHLGEHTLWCKRTQFEIATRAPLIVSVPGIEECQKTQAITEFIDLYPSLCELCGLPLPGHLEGFSFVPVLRNPKLAGDGTAFAHIGHGYSVRENHYRYAEYRDEDGEFVSRMLYDHRSDPNENLNISEIAENQNIVTKLSKLINKKY